MLLSSFLYLAASGISAKKNATLGKPLMKSPELAETFHIFELTDFEHDELNAVFEISVPEPVDPLHEPVTQEERIAIVRLESFHLVLIDYVHVNSFYTERFTKDLPQLCEEYLNIVNFSKDLSPRKDLIYRLKFTQYMFRAMALAAYSLKSYNLMGSLEDYLLYCVIELNVRLLVMYTSNGFPDLQMEQFAYKINRFSGFLTILNMDFQDLPDVSFKNQEVYVKHSRMAQRELNTLKSYTPFISQELPID